MSEIMKGVGLAHTLAGAFTHAEAQFGQSKNWTDAYIDALTTKDGKEHILGPLLDVLRGDAEIVPKKRLIDVDSVKPGDMDIPNKDGGVVVSNRSYPRIPNPLVLGEFTIGVASRTATNFFERYQFEVERGNYPPRPKTLLDVPKDPCMLSLSRQHMLPRYLIGKNLPGIALRNFYHENPHHIPECFSDIVLFWGTICKNNFCYYVPGIKRNGSLYAKRICSYKVVNGKDELEDDVLELNPYDAAVFI